MTAWQRQRQGVARQLLLFSISVLYLLVVPYCQGFAPVSHLCKNGPFVRRAILLQQPVGAAAAAVSAAVVQQAHCSYSPTLLTMSSPNNNNNDNVNSSYRFDITKAVFDLYSLRQIRGDALTKYNSLNQSEPLRINLSALAAFILAVTPLLAPELSADGSSLTVPQTASVLVGAVVAAANFVRECQRRDRQLTRLEKELQAVNLTIRRPASLIADAPYQTRAVRIAAEQQKSGLRVLAIAGNAAQLTHALQELAVFGRRLTQANCMVVAVPVNYGVDTVPKIVQQLHLGRPPWLAQAGDVDQWRAYLESLGSDGNNNDNDDDNKSDNASSLTWFGLSAGGRSFGSGTTAPIWLQMLGQHLRPMTVLDQDDPAIRRAGAVETESAVLEQQVAFYRALTTGDEAAMLQICDSAAADSVSAVVKAGGRLDAWSTCLEDGNRPANMKASDQDVTVVTDSTAISTCIEFPADLAGATLLAVQTWVQRDEEGGWKLAQHQTIPWADQAAAGTLLCDCRGCVTLVRAPDKRTFGGLIG